MPAPSGAATTLAMLGTSQVGKCQLARIDEETARVQALSNAGIEALCPLLNAMDTGGVARKIARFVVASAIPGAALGRVYEREPDGFTDFCLQLAAFRTYIARIKDGDPPARAANAAERARCAPR